MVNDTIMTKNAIVQQNKKNDLDTIAVTIVLSMTGMLLQSVTVFNASYPHGTF